MSHNQTNSKKMPIQVLSLDWCNRQLNHFDQACQHHTSTIKKQECTSKLQNYCENNVFTSNVAESFQASIREVVNCSGNQECINKLNIN